MLYLLQKELNMKEEIEITIIKSIIEDSFEYKMGISEYREISITEICNIENKQGIPIGSLEFVGKWLKHFYNKSMKPIEVPKILRKDEFLKREYRICRVEDFPKVGNYFVKNADKLKDWTYCGDIRNIMQDIKEGVNYVISQEVEILSEWRVYVIRDKVENIVNYDGDVKIFPDIVLINKAVAMYASDIDRPKSYTMDIMVTQLGTAIIELHSFVSVGLYSTFWGINLLRAYEDGIKYYVKR